MARATGSGNRPNMCGSGCPATAAVAFRVAVRARLPTTPARTVRRGPPRVALRRLVAVPRRLTRAGRRLRRVPGNPTAARASVAGSGTVRCGSCSPRRVQTFVRAMRHRDFRARSMDRCSWSAVPQARAAAISLVMNGICRCRDWGCVALRFIRLCTWSKSGLAAGSGQISLTAETLLS
jgi:hypothetical protein